MIILVFFHKYLWIEVILFLNYICIPATIPSFLYNMLFSFHLWDFQTPYGKAMINRGDMDIKTRGCVGNQ